jgi:hypothetical protein
MANSTHLFQQHGQSSSRLGGYVSVKLLFEPIELFRELVDLFPSAGR